MLSSSQGGGRWAGGVGTASAQALQQLQPLPAKLGAFPGPRARPALLPRPPAAPPLPHGLFCELEAMSPQSLSLSLLQCPKIPAPR